MLRSIMDISAHAVLLPDRPRLAAEERARELEAEASHFRDRAARAEDWLLRIHNEVEQTFFQDKERDSRQPRKK